jgi:hypothetical protein
MCNFTLNVEEDDLTKVSMIPGDWASCLEKLGSSKYVDCLCLKYLLYIHRFDIILTSETLYNVDNYEALYNLIDKSLTSDGKVSVLPYKNDFIDLFEDILDCYLRN